MKVLITGVAGFLGSHLADKFLQNGDKVLGIDNLIGGYKESIPNGVEFHQKDLANLNEIKSLFKGVDIVVHTACTAYEGLSVFSPNLVVQNTMQITASVLSASISNKVDKFIYMSSMARYGSQPNLPFTEDMIPAPQDPYGIAKVGAEMLVRNLSDTHGMNYVILVPHNIIGPRQKFDDPYRNVASIMINRILQGKEPIIYGNGQQKRCFSFIDDVIDPLMKACTLNHVHGQVINIGPDEEFITINELAFTIAELMDVKIKPVYMPGRPQEVLHANCSADKARKILQYSTKVSLREGLGELISFVKENGPRDFSYHLPLEFETATTPRTWTEKLM